MIIDELTLAGYKHFALSTTQVVTIRPSKQMQVVIGTNGCGKSSFLSELSPLPGNKDDFITGGKKIIKLRHNGSSYVLTSSFERGQHHSFIKDDQPDLNSGGTQTVQKELVLREFGLSPELHALLLGKTTFTAMSPQERRYWITKLSQIDHTFALGLFNAYKTKARDQQGVVKHLGSRIVQETSKLHGLGDLDGIEERVDILNGELRVLLANRNEKAESQPFDPDPVLHVIEDEIAWVRRNIQYVPKGKSYKSMQDVEDDIQLVAAQQSTHASFIQRYTRDYTEVEDTINRLTKLHEATGGQGTIDEALQAATNRMIEATAQIQHFDSGDSPELALEGILTLRSSLVELFQKLPDNSEGHYTKTAYEGAQQLLKGYKEKRDYARIELTKLQFEIDLHERAKEIECPSCQYVWKPGYDEDRLNHLLGMAESKKERLEKIAFDIEKENERLTVLEETSHLYRQFRSMVQLHPRLKPLWDEILEKRLHMINPAGQVHVFYVFEQDMVAAIQRDRAKGEIEELYKLKANPQSSSEVGYLQSHLNDLSRRVSEATVAHQESTEELRMIISYRDAMIQTFRGVAQIQEKVDIINCRAKEEVERMRNQHIDRAMATRHQELASVQSSLNDKRMLQTILEDLHNSYGHAETQALVYKLLSKAMSPTEGITADQLQGTIRGLTNRMNGYINKVWTYDMSILPCTMEDGELDYKFPIRRPNRTDVTKDIALGSKSQVNFINFTFRLVAMLYHGLKEYPFYLDELEEGFDERHRPALIGLIQRIIEQHPTSQIFMVSHYFSMYGSLGSTQVFVVDDANVSVPEGANEHVTFS